MSVSYALTINYYTILYQHNQSWPPDISFRVVGTTMGVSKDVETWPETYDGYSALHTQNPMYLNGGIPSVECES